MKEFTTLGKREKARILKENRGLLARVAKHCQVHPVTAGQVYWGRCTSKRIAVAINEQLAAIGEQAAAA